MFSTASEISRAVRRSVPFTSIPAVSPATPAFPLRSPPTGPPPPESPPPPPWAVRPRRSGSRARGPSSRPPGCRRRSPPGSCEGTFARTPRRSAWSRRSPRGGPPPIATRGRRGSRSPWRAWRARAPPLPREERRRGGEAQRPEEDLLGVSPPPLRRQGAPDEQEPGVRRRVRRRVHRVDQPFPVLDRAVEARRFTAPEDHRQQVPRVDVRIAHGGPVESHVEVGGPRILLLCG